MTPPYPAPPVVASSAPTNNGVSRNVANTTLGGFNLQNGTPTILSWTAPNDGQPHSVVVNATVNVTVAETGGAVTLTWTTAGAVKTATISAGGAGVGTTPVAVNGIMVDANTTVTLAQTSAMTAGTCQIIAEILADHS